MNIDSALEKIYSLKQFHVKLGLDNITHLLKHIGNPHLNLKIFHIAGSNGKGSTCSFMASILQEYGHKVGLYTSPHFVRFNERIRINSNEIPNEAIIDFLERNKKYIDQYKPTFFEITTALAFEYFNDNEVDFAVIETGLGGRLDATNIISPIAAVITSISMEHKHILGDTLKKIAYEKAGIIKENIPTFIGELPYEAENEIDKVTEERNSRLFKFQNFTKRISDGYEIAVEKQKILISNVGLKGSHQIKNAALAVKTISESLGYSNINNITSGLKKVIMNTGIQGRYEKFGVNSNIIFDAAHNLEGVEIFIDEFRRDKLPVQNCTLIFGAMRDKEISEMLLILNPFFNEIFVTSTNYERAASAEEIYDIASNNDIKVSIITKPEQIVSEYFAKERNDILVILGSIYLLGDIKRKIST